MTDPYTSHPAGYGVVPAETAATLGGLSFLRAMMAGEFAAPPFARLLRMRPVLAEEGRVIFEAEPMADFLNPLGTVHGGWSAALLDSAMACAVHSTLRAGEAYTTLEFKIHCVRAILPTSGLLRCEGKIVSRGRRAATSEGRLVDGEGKLLAHGTETCLVFETPQAVK